MKTKVKKKLTGKRAWRETGEVQHGRAAELGAVDGPALWGAGPGGRGARAKQPRRAGWGPGRGKGRRRGAGRGGGGGIVSAGGGARGGAGRGASSGLARNVGRRGPGRGAAPATRPGARGSAHLSGGAAAAARGS